MKNAVVLNAGERPYAYAVNVAANHGIEPDAAALTDHNVSYDTGTWGYESIFGNPGQDPPIGK
jgi:hypothetical protein